jgi:hypothetical protein
MDLFDRRQYPVQRVNKNGIGKQWGGGILAQLSLKAYLAGLWIVSIPLAMVPRGTTISEVWFATLLLLDTMHVLAPMLLSWSNRDLRKIMLGEWRKYVAIPGALFVGAVAIGVMTAMGWTAYAPTSGPVKAHATGLSNPFPILFAIYLVWNYWHFSMQNYGVLRLWGVRPGRWAKLAAFAGTAISIKLLPLVVFVNHGLTDLGLSLRVAPRRWWFLIILAALSPAVFLWDAATPHGAGTRPLEGIIIVFAGVRLGLSLAHYYCSRWTWRLSDPRVRAAHGKELFA